MLNILKYFCDSPRNQILDLTKKYLKKGEKILDAGCGSGEISFDLLKQGFRIFGVDRLSEEIDKCHQKVDIYKLGGKDNFIVSDIKSLPFEKDFFDGILSVSVMHFSKSEHVFELLLSEQWRVLKTGGIFICRLQTGKHILYQHFQISPRKFNDLITLAGGKILLEGKTSRTGFSNWVIMKN